MSAAPSRSPRRPPPGQRWRPPPGPAAGGCGATPLTRSGGFAKGVADQPDGVDHRRPGDVELLAQVADVGLDDVGVTPEVVVPHVIEDLALRQHPPGVEEKEAQEAELG